MEDFVLHFYTGYCKLGHSPLCVHVYLSVCTCIDVGTGEARWVMPLDFVNSP